MPEETQQPNGRALDWLNARIDRLEDRMEERFDGLIEEMRTMHGDHERRLRGLERWRYMIAGVGVAIGAVGKAALDYVRRG